MDVDPVKCDWKTFPSLQCDELTSNLIRHAQLDLDPATGQPYIAVQLHPPGSLTFQSMNSELHSAKKGFSLASAISFNNPILSSIFKGNERIISRLNQGNANVQTLFHVTSWEALEDILFNGFDPCRAKEGLLGRGIYFSSNPMKCNDYSQLRGDPTKLRCMLRCSVILGRVNDLGVGRFDRALTSPGENKDSVKAHVRRAEEYCIYHAGRVLVTDILIYRFTDPAAELADVQDIPAGVKGKVFFITASLSEFLTAVQSRATTAGAEAHEAVRTAIGEVLRSIIAPETFVDRLQAALRAPPPPGLLGKLYRELEKSGITPLPHTPAPTESMAPPPYSPAPIESMVPLDSVARKSPRADATAPSTLPEKPHEPASNRFFPLSLASNIS